MRAVTLSEVCADHAPSTIHFLKVDVEGHERSVLEGLDLARYRPWIIVMEAVAPNRADVPTFGEWEDILLANRYLPAAADELNRYYVSAEKAELADALRLPIDNSGRSSEARQVDERRRRVAELEERLDRAQAPPSKVRGWRSRFGRMMAMAGGPSG